MMNLETARHHMIQQQLRTCERMSPDTVDMLYASRREHYVPAASRSFAYADTAIPLSPTAAMLTPKLEVRLLQEANVQAGETVLEVGTGSGHMAALLAERAARVWTVEIDAALAETARANLAADGAANVTVETGDGLDGLPGHAPYDCIVVSGGVAEIPATLTAQLKVGGRLFAFVAPAGKAPVMVLRRIVRQASDTYVEADLLETAVPMLQGGETVRKFLF